MKTQLLTLGLLIGGCGSIDHLATSIDNASKTASATSTNTDTATAANTKTGSKTVTTSTTTTVSESGDQSVLSDAESVPQTAQKDPVPNGVQKPIVSPIVGTWLEACDDGISYKKEFGADGTLTVTTFVYDNQQCDGSNPPEVFVQKRKYQVVAEDTVQIGNDAPITINVSGDNNTVIIGNQELQKH